MLLPEAMKLTSIGVDFEQFAVGLNLASLPEAAQFVARGKEMTKMHELLHARSITLFTISAFFFRLRASLFVHTTTCVILNYIFLYQF
jgi:hypothetical protein